MEELVTKALKGDEEAFKELMLSVKSELYGVAKQILKNDDDISDAIQETTIKAFNNLNDIRNKSNFKAWVTTILINSCKQIYKKEKKNILVIDSMKNVSEENMYDFPMERADCYIDFHRRIENLKMDEQLILELHYQNRYSASMIAKILGMNVNTVKSKITRSVEKLRKEENKKNAKRKR